MTKQRRCSAPPTLDAESAGSFRAELESLVGDTSVHEIVVDCRDLTFIDSSGLRALLSAQQALESQSRRLRVANVSTTIRRTFDLTGVTGVLRAG